MRRGVISEFNEPVVAQNTIKLKTTNQNIEEFPKQSTAVELGVKAAPNSGTPSGGTKVRRRGGKAEAEAGAEAIKEAQEAEAEASHFISTEQRLLQDTLEQQVSESQSDVRDFMGEQDYRHKRLAAPSNDAPPSKRRQRRSTRFQFEEPQPPSSASTSSTSASASKPPPEPQPQPLVPKIKLKSNPQNNDTIEPKQEDEIINNDFCGACGGTGELLCCETCANSFHFSCIEPPVLNVEEIKEENWSCRQCAPQKLNSTELKQVDSTFFAPIIHETLKQNSVSYQLPAGIRKLFENIKTNKFGEFVDEFRKPENTSLQGQRVQDKFGEPLLCFKCQLSGLKTPLAICSQCSQCFHVDCVDPPLESTPLGFWICPLHPGNSGIDLPPKVSQCEVKPVQLKRNVSNDGIIEVLDDDDRISAGEFDEEVTKQVKFPAKTRILDTGDIVARYPTHKQSNTDNIVYQLSSRTIKLDFLSKVYQYKRQIHETPQSELLVALDCLVSKGTQEQEAVRNLMSLKLQGPAVSAAQAKENLAVLVDAVMDDENEIGQVAAIKKLMKEKGKERLLELLRTE